MSSASRRTRWIAAAVLVLPGCYAPLIQHVANGSPVAVEVRNDEPAYVTLDRDSTIRYAMVRLVGDTLYGWEYQERRAPKDSVAISLRRVRAIEQSRLNVADTVVAVVTGTMAAVVLSYGILILLYIRFGD